MFNKKDKLFPDILIRHFLSYIVGNLYFNRLIFLEAKNKLVPFISVHSVYVKYVYVSVLSAHATR